MMPRINNDLEVISLAFSKKCEELLGSSLQGVYFYGSSIMDDFTKTSDYDFVVVVRSINTGTLGIVEEILLGVSSIPGSDKLEGGFYTLFPYNPWRDSLSIWVDKGMKASECQMHIEHDSVFAICTFGRCCYGPEPSNLFPKITEEELMQFEKRYIDEFNDNLQRRCTSAQRLFGALLNAFRSACFIIDKEYLTKTQAAQRIVELVPKLEQVAYKALLLRYETESISISDKDIQTCKMAIELLKQRIGDNQQ